MRWLIAFGVMVIADLILLLAPQVSPHVGIALTVAALAWALMQTKKLSGRAKTDGRGFSK